MNRFSQYYCFYFFNQINAALVSIYERDFIQKHKKILMTPNF